MDCQEVKIENYSLVELHEVARNLITSFKEERFFAFFGKMGVGKTTLIKEMCDVLGVVDVVCNQSDQAATLLGQLGLPHGKFRFSRDVFSQNYTQPFAYHTFNNGFSMVDSTRFVVYDLTSNQTVVGNAPDLIERGKAILQITSEDLNLR